jgi:hypothetical protein
MPPLPPPLLVSASLILGCCTPISISLSPPISRYRPRSSCHCALLLVPPHTENWNRAWKAAGPAGSLCRGHIWFTKEAHTNSPGPPSNFPAFRKGGAVSSWSIGRQGFKHTRFTKMQALRKEMFKASGRAASLSSSMRSRSFATAHTTGGSKDEFHSVGK